MYSSGNGSLVFWDSDASSARLQIDTSGNSTFVGSVTGTIARFDTLNNNANSANIIYRSGTDTIVGGGSPPNKIYIQDSGNVGIGATSPAAKLEVNGNIKLSSTAGQTATPSYIWLGNDYSNGQTRDKLKIYLYNSGTEQYGFTVGSQSDMQYHSNQEHDFYVANSLKVRINQSGNVGIGTDTPSALLEIQTAGTSGTQDFQIFSRGESPNYEVFKISRAAGSTELLANQNLTLSADYDANHTSVDSNIIFKTDNTEKMRIDPSGNVNIKLGNLSIGQSSEQNISNITGETWIGSNGLRYNSGSNTFARTSASAQAAMMILTTTADVEFYAQPSTSSTGTYALSPKMVIKGATGNVGIGTAGPDSKIQVEARNGSNVIYAGFRVGYNATSNNYYDADTHHFRLGTGSSAGGNLYVGGGVYLGGTATANKLDDYEEGTFAVRLQGSGGQPAHSIQAGFYTKVGNVVTCVGTYTWNSSGSNANTTTKLEGFPFVNSSTANARAVGSLGAVNGIALGYTLRLVMDPGHAGPYIIQQNSTGYSHNNTISASGEIYGFELTYRTN
jgi:hypothetical protein